MRRRKGVLMFSAMFYYDVGAKIRMIDQRSDSSITFFDTVTVINEGNQEDDPCSTGSNLFNDDNSSAGSYNDSVQERKNSDLEEDMLPKQKSNNRKKLSEEKEKCTLS